LKRNVEESREFTGVVPLWKTEQSVKEFMKAVCS